MLGVHTNDKAIDKLISFVAELCHESKSGTIGVRGVFLQEGGGYFPAHYVAGLLQLCNAGL